MSKVIPILKWAGGKRQLLPQIVPLMPQKYTKYYEPFVGAGAVLFDQQPKRAIVNDTNSELINVYRVVKAQPEELITLLQQYEQKHSNEFYYEVRDIDRNAEAFASISPIEKAARTIYLNRACYNGLYRVNQKGWFNTPIGRNSVITIVNADGIRAMSEYLNKADITFLNGDYKQALGGVTKRDFVFIDPPYYPMKTDSFLRYATGSFGVEAQKELKELCDKLTKKGVRLMQTNSDCDEIRELYNDYNLVEVDVRRSINAHADGRRGKELIICNY